jgi:hypothetical protein
MGRKTDPEIAPRWFVVWLPFLFLSGFFFFEESGDVTGAALARAGVAAKVTGSPAEAFGRLLDMGPDHRAALTTRRMLASVLPKDVARDVVVERFQHWTGRTPASYQLGTAGAPAFPLLAALLDHEKERVRQQAAFALGDVGLQAAAAAPALEKLARRSPPDASSRAASSALGDVAPLGLSGWLLKIWYETPLAPAIGLLLAALAALVVQPRYFAMRTPEDLRRIVPPAWVAPVAAACAAALLAFGLTDLLGARFTVEADVWAIFAGVWSADAAWFSLGLRRRAGAPSPG